MVKFSEELCKNICDDIKEGVPVKHASISQGIDESTFYVWYNKGKNAKSGKYKKFYEQVNEARSAAVTLRAKRVYKAGETSWQADAWWLERMVPESFARKDNVNMEVKPADKVLEENADTITRFIERRIKPED